MFHNFNELKSSNLSILIVFARFSGSLVLAYLLRPKEVNCTSINPGMHLFWNEWAPNEICEERWRKKTTCETKDPSLLIPSLHRFSRPFRPLQSTGECIAALFLPSVISQLGIYSIGFVSKWTRIERILFILFHWRVCTRDSLHCRHLVEERRAWVAS